MADGINTSFDDTNQENADDMEFVTMVDVLKEEQELEEDANAVLGGSDEKNCTYSKGYLKRQALYACMTCNPEARNDLTKRAGVCLACSYQCHEGHELIELYTKRSFRCDCGNAKFPGKKCNLDDSKSDLNEKNSYNHNFSGVYCTCERPYPDPEDNVVDDMIQCIVCEDWYHCRHLNVNIPALSYAEMICTHCVSEHRFLLKYSGLSLTLVTGSEEVMVKIEPDLSAEPETVVSESQEGGGNTCTMPKGRLGDVTAKFWPENWRQQLCICDGCKHMYEIENVGFLLDSSDTVHAYEEKGKAKALENQAETQYEQGMKALSSLDRIKQVEAITEYNTMKEHLKEYLQKFAENKKIVREEDIKEFFSSMTAKKKQKVDIPYFCR